MDYFDLEEWTIFNYCELKIYQIPWFLGPSSEPIKGYLTDPEGGGQDKLLPRSFLEKEEKVTLLDILLCYILAFTP